MIGFGSVDALEVGLVKRRVLLVQSVGFVRG